MIAKIDGVMNGISVVGDKVGETLYYGPGAGGDATASAVIADLVDIARGGKGAMLGFSKPLESGLTLASKDDITSKYYIRMEVKDEAGVLEKITAILAKESISIETMLQRASGDTANLLLSTHTAKEKSIQNALQEISALTSVKSKPVLIRIED